MSTYQLKVKEIYQKKVVFGTRIGRECHTLSDNLPSDRKIQRTRVYNDNYNGENVIQCVVCLLVLLFGVSFHLLLYPTLELLLHVEATRPR